MSITKPMTAVRRAVAYQKQGPAGMTAAQVRRTRHKNNRIMGENGGGKLTPKRVTNRPNKPAPRVMLPWGMKARRVRPVRVTWSPEASDAVNPYALTPDDIENGVRMRPHTFGNGDEDE